MKFAKIAAVVAAAGGALLAPALPAGAEVGVEPAATLSITIDSPAIVETHGAVVRVSLTVVCPAGNSASVDIDVTQRSQGGVASGSRSGTVTCTGTPQTVELAVTAEDKPFHKRSAYVTARLGVPMVGSATDEREIEFTR